MTLVNKYIFPPFRGKYNYYHHHLLKEQSPVKIHEYQAKDILARYGIPIQPGRVAHTPEDAEAIARELGGPVVIKAQVYVGGRGKAGGIQLADTPEQARAASVRVIGMDIKGLTVEKVLVISKLHIQEEYSLGIILNRKS